MQLPLQNHVLQFTLLVTVALLVQQAAKRLHLPGLVGLLLAGMLLGPGALAVLPREPVAELMGEIGLVYIMFMAGVEINLQVLRAHRREVAGFGTLSFVLAYGAVAAAAWWLDFGWAGALLLATALASHTLVAYPMVQQLGLEQRQPVVTAVGGTLLTDTLALVSLAVLIQQVRQEDGGAWGWLQPLALLAGLVALAGWAVPRLARAVFASAMSRAEKALFVLVVLLVLASAARLIGTESILGAFLAGLCLNPALREREELHEHLGFVGRMVFIPFFFIDTGMRIALEVLGDAGVWRLAAVLLAVVVLAKAAAAWASGWFHGYGRTDRLLMFGLTVPQAAATLAVVVTASAAGAFERQVVDAVILVILVTCLAGPLLARLAGQRLLRRAEPAPDSPVRKPHKDMG